MGASKAAKKQGTGNKGTQRNHFCPQCDQAASPIMRMPGRRISFVCKGGHEIAKGLTVLK